MSRPAVNFRKAVFNDRARHDTMRASFPAYSAVAIPDTTMPEADLLQACLDELDGVDDFLARSELAEQHAPVLLGRPGVASGLAALVARTEDSEPNAPLDLFGVLTERAQLDAENRGRFGEPFLAEARGAIDTLAAGGDLPDHAALGLARAFIRAGLEAPECLFPIFAGEPGTGQALAAFPGFLDQEIDRLARHAGGDDHLLHDLLDNLMTVLPPEFRPTFVQHVSGRDEQRYGHAALDWLLDRSPEIRLAAASGLSGRVRRDAVQPALPALVPLIRNWMPEDSARPLLDTALREARLWGRFHPRAATARPISGEADDRTRHPIHPAPPAGALPANVRKTEPGKSAFAELKASIAAHGLLENLVARDVGPADDPGTGPGQVPGERFAVIAGARRLAALNELAGEGVIEADHPVPCRIVANGAADGEISLAENVVRVAMHPADQVEAFGALALAGAIPADIAARFGVSERIVEQRLRLGHAAPELLDAYRENAIDLETLKAFAVTTDTARQLAVWEQVRDQGYRPTGWQIRRMLTDDRIPAGAALARYVGVDAYEAAGGPVLRDLFADEHENGVWLEDPALLMQLALDRLKMAADELATRWKWAEARIDVQWSDLARFGRVRPTPAEPTDEEKAEIERLHTRHDELVNMDEDAWTDELIEEAETIEPRLEEIQDAIKARAVFKPEDIAIAGCIVTVGSDGALQVVQGLVRPEDMPADTDTANSGAAAHEGSGQADGQQATSGIQSPSVSGPAMPPARPDPEAEARKEAGVGIGLADDLRAVRTALVKAHLAEHFGAAFDLMLFQMGRAVFTPGYHDHALDIAVRETAARPRRSGSTTTPSAAGAPARPCWRTVRRCPSTGWRSRTARSPSRR